MSKLNFSLISVYPKRMDYILYIIKSQHNFSNQARNSLILLNHIHYQKYDKSTKFEKSSRKVKSRNCRENQDSVIARLCELLAFQSKLSNGAQQFDLHHLHAYLTMRIGQMERSLLWTKGSQNISASPDYPSPCFDSLFGKINVCSQMFHVQKNGMRLDNAISETKIQLT